MFPSFNCDDNSFESLLKKPSDQNPSSKQDHDPPFLFNFPSPFLDEHESPLSQIFFQTHQIMADDLCPSDQTNKNDAAGINIGESKLVEKEDDQEIPTRIAAPLRRRNLGVVPRRRTGKKDRHSKICTAQGVRDRRMRLSLQVARKFFDLQDMLGYDKASKTIEWLFTKSKKAIKELISDHHHQRNNISISDAKSESFLSECEVVSGLIEENASNKDFKAESVVPPTKMQKIEGKSSTRESREKARARARCRTREKMMVKGLEYSGQWCKPNPTGNGHVQKLGFEGVDQESKNQILERVSPLYDAACSSLEYPLADVSTIEKFLGNSSSSSSSWGNSMLPVVSALVGCGNSENCSVVVPEPNCSFMGFFGNWDLLNNDRTCSIYSVANRASSAGNPNSVYSGATDEFP